MKSLKLITIKWYQHIQTYITYDSLREVTKSQYTTMAGSVLPDMGLVINDIESWMIEKIVRTIKYHLGLERILPSAESHDLSWEYKRLTLSW